MTADELRKLAEIAGFKPKEMMGNIRVWQKRVADWVLWQPHLKIEQAIMVAEEFHGYEIGKNMDVEFPYPRFYCQLYEIGPGLVSVGEGEGLSEAICRAALASKEDDGK